MNIKKKKKNILYNRNNKKKKINNIYFKNKKQKQSSYKSSCIFY